jgi:hypothetical protein
MEATYLWPHWLSGSHQPRCGDDAPPGPYYTSPITAAHFSANGSSQPATDMLVVPWTMRVRAIIIVPLYMDNLYRPCYYSSSPRSRQAACPTVALRKESDTVPRAEVGALQSAARLHGTAALLSLLVLTGWGAVALARWRFVE